MSICEVKTCQNPSSEWVSSVWAKMCKTHYDEWYELANAAHRWTAENL